VAKLSVNGKPNSTIIGLAFRGYNTSYNMLTVASIMTLKISLVYNTGHNKYKELLPT
jgi:predicted ester cyclase